jgi:hypothetical protein
MVIGDKTPALQQVLLKPAKDNGAGAANPLI